MERTSSRASHSETARPVRVGGSAIQRHGGAVRLTPKRTCEARVHSGPRADRQRVGTDLALLAGMKLLAVFAVAALSVGSAREADAQLSTNGAAPQPAPANPWVDPNDPYAGYAYPAPPAAPAPVAPPPAPVVESGGPTSPGLIVAGVFMMLAGGGGLIAGGFLFGGGTDNCDALIRAAENASPTADASSLPNDNPIAACQAEVTRKVAGTVSMISGGAFLLAGLPLLIVGATPEDAPTQVSFKVGPTGGGLEVRF